MLQTPYDQSLFTIRFTGDDFSKRGVSIYDLGITLMSFQRLINKTFLLSRHRLEKGAFPKKEEREHLALQIGARERKSDAFGLIPFISDPATIHVLRHVGEALFSGLMSYYVQDVIQRLRKEPDDDKRFYIGSINAEVVNLVSRIEAAGGVGSIEIGAPTLGHSKPVVFDAKTKAYVSELTQNNFLGKMQKIIGTLTKMFPSSYIVEIRRPGGSLVKVHMNQDLFHKVRYDRSGLENLEFTGRPIYPLGATSTKIYEFESHEVEFLPDETEEEEMNDPI